MKKILLTTALLALASLGSAAEAGFKPIFNGKDLSGWKGLDFWSVKNGAIVGQTTAEHPTKGNTFLVYQNGEPANFELRLQFRLTGQNDRKWGNSGVQYRSKVVDAAGFVVAGYQADIDSPFNYTGMLYEEKGRGILMATGEKIRIGETTMVDDAKKAGAKRSKTAVEKLPGATPAAEIGEMPVVMRRQFRDWRSDRKGVGIHLKRSELRNHITREILMHELRLRRSHFRDCN